MIFEGTVRKEWTHQLDDGGELICFALNGEADHAFHGPDGWAPLLIEAFELRTRVRVMASAPEVVKCADPQCGDGCCADENCTNVPEEERTTPFLLRADTIEWL